MSLITSVTLDRSFISLASDPTVYVSCGTSGSVGGGGSRTDAFTQEGSFRQYANNVTRLILGSLTTRVNTFALRALTPAQLDIVQSMVGKTCLFRDTYGRKLWGSFLVTTVTDLPLSGNAYDDLKSDVAIQFQSVTYTEGLT